MKTVKKEDQGKLNHALGQARTQYRDFADQGVDQTVIDALQTADVNRINKKLGTTYTVEDWLEMVNAVPVRTGNKVTEAKEDFRAEFDRLTNNLLAKINNTTDEDIANARTALLDFAKSYKDSTGVNQPDREDWRPMLILSPLMGNLDKLAIYKGGWADGAKIDRNQYSNGRLVPHAKSTGYKLAQEEPEFTEVDSDEPEETEDQ